MVEKDKQSVRNVSSQIFSRLAKSKDSPSGKAHLARLRNSIGKPGHNSHEVWPLLFENLPEYFLGYTGELSHEERAILTSLQLYALHQQGLSSNVLIDLDLHPYSNIGTSFKEMRLEEKNRLSTDRRFNTLISSATFQELTHHLRQMVSLYRSRTKEAGKINYSQLAEDLYWYSRGYGDSVRLKWAREYYRSYKKGDTENDK